MPDIIANGRIINDDWHLLREIDGALPKGRLIVPLAYWNVHHLELAERGDIGVWLAPDESPSIIAGDLLALPLIAIDFPTHMDGRGFSLARELRENHSYTGEIRAVGHFMRDQLWQLKRCGFNAFALQDTDLQAALSSFKAFSEAYQADTLQPTPLFRRR